MIAGWIVDKRAAICAKCERGQNCGARFGIANAAPPCPLKLLPTEQEEIAARAWPEGAQPVSGCCDSAQNYLSGGPWV
jgi:hypothetical protein